MKAEVRSPVTVVVTVSTNSPRPRFPGLAGAGAWPPLPVGPPKLSATASCSVTRVTRSSSNRYQLSCDQAGGGSGRSDEGEGVAGRMSHRGRWEGLRCRGPSPGSCAFGLLDAEKNTTNGTRICLVKNSCRRITDFVIARTFFYRMAPWFRSFAEAKNYLEVLVNCFG